MSFFAFFHYTVKFKGQGQRSGSKGQGQRSRSKGQGRGQGQGHGPSATPNTQSVEEFITQRHQSTPTLVFSCQRSSNERFLQDGNACRAELSKTNWTVLQPDMSPDPRSVPVPFDFPNSLLLLTYLLTYLKVINPQNSGIAAPIATKL